MYVMFIYIYAYGRNNIILLDDVPTLKFMYFRVSRLAMLDTPWSIKIEKHDKPLLDLVLYASFRLYVGRCILI